MQVHDVYINRPFKSAVSGWYAVRCAERGDSVKCTREELADAAARLYESERMLEMVHRGFMKLVVNVYRRAPAPPTEHDVNNHRLRLEANKEATEDKIDEPVDIDAMMDDLAVIDEAKEEVKEGEGNGVCDVDDVDEVVVD